MKSKEQEVFPIFSFCSLAFSGAHCVLLLIGIEKANQKNENQKRKIKEIFDSNKCFRVESYFTFSNIMAIEQIFTLFHHTGYRQLYIMRIQITVSIYFYSFVCYKLRNGIMVYVYLNHFDSVPLAD